MNEEFLSDILEGLLRIWPGGRCLPTNFLITELPQKDFLNSWSGDCKPHGRTACVEVPRIRQVFKRNSFKFKRIQHQKRHKKKVKQSSYIDARGFLKGEGALEAGGEAVE